jgi:hypothetical protein
VVLAEPAMALDAYLRAMNCPPAIGVPSLIAGARIGSFGTHDGHALYYAETVSSNGPYTMLSELFAAASKKR